MRKQYRNYIDSNTEGTDVIEISKVILMVNEIELLVNNIRDMLGEHTSLTEIKEIYNLTNELSEKLY